MKCRVNLHDNANIFDKCLTLPVGNLAKNSLVVLVSPKTKFDAVLTLAPEYSAAISTFHARKLSGYVYKVCKN